jgi:hypothetical protein
VKPVTGYGQAAVTRGYLETTQREKV